MFHTLVYLPSSYKNFGVDQAKARASCKVSHLSEEAVFEHLPAVICMAGSWIGSRAAGTLKLLTICDASLADHGLIPQHWPQKAVLKLNKLFSLEILKQVIFSRNVYLLML